MTVDLVVINLVVADLVTVDLVVVDGDGFPPPSTAITCSPVRRRPGISRCYAGDRLLTSTA